MNHDSMNRQAAEDIYRLASVSMKRGIALMNENATASLREAVVNFDRAIALRQNLPLDLNPMFRYGLAAGWLNRGDALTRLGLFENLAEALRSYDAALEVLRRLPLDSNPLFRRRLAIAWQNRGLTLQAQGTAAPAEAGRSLREAIATLEHGNAAAISDRNYLLAAAWMNYANVLADEKKAGTAAPVRTAAQQALRLAARIETEDPAMAEVGLKARHILCQAIAELIRADGGDANQSDLARDGLIAEATDAVDDGMALARSWEQRNQFQFRSLAQSLFHFGARAYQIHQPHFLNEFLLENLDPAHATGVFANDSVMHAAAWESLWRAFRELQRDGFKTLNTPQFDGLLEKLRDLSLAETRLAELRRQYLAAQ